MTEQERYDQLNTAIDALLTGGRAAPTGDSELDALARMATGLRYLPDPDFRVRLGAELVPERADGRLTSVRDWIERVMRRPFVVAPVAFAAGATAVTIAVLVITNVIGGGAEREAFGTLPAPDLTGSGNGRGGLGGGGDPLQIGPPGGAITWTLEGGLSLPESAPVYRLRGYEFSAATVEAVARGLGLEGTVETVRNEVDGTVQGFELVSSEEWCSTPAPAPSPAPGEAEQQQEKYCEPVARLGLSVGGYVQFYAPRVGYEMDLSAEAPSEDAAKAVAQEWLQRSGLTAGEPFVLTSPGVGFGAPGARRVKAGPLRPEGPLLDYPNVVLDITADGQVLLAISFWASIDAESTYPLRTPEQMLADLQELRGAYSWHLPFLGEEPPMCGTDPCPAGIAGILDPYRDFSATVERVEVGYTRAAGADGQEYFVPLYVVHGHLSQEGLAEPVPFTTWVPAVDAAPSALFEQAPNELFAVARSLVSPRETVLFSPPDAFTLQGSSEGTSRLFFGFVTWSEQTPEQITEFARRELLARGWQPEEPPAIRSVDPSEATDSPPRPYTSVSSFVKEDVRVAVLVLVNPDWNPGATAVDIVVEER